MDRTWKEIKRDMLTNPEVKIEYDNLAIEYELIRQVIKARIEKDLTQAELALKVGTKQSNISRLESGEYNPSLDFIERVAAALDKKIEIKLI
jgi:DNA-binding XRE family transcriptional regulator